MLSELQASSMSAYELLILKCRGMSALFLRSPDRLWDWCTVTDDTSTSTRYFLLPRDDLVVSDDSLDFECK